MDDDLSEADIERIYKQYAPFLETPAGKELVEMFRKLIMEEGQDGEPTDTQGTAQGKTGPNQDDGMFRKLIMEEGQDGEPTDTQGTAQGKTGPNQDDGGRPDRKGGKMDYCYRTTP